MSDWPTRVIFDYARKVKDEGRVECIEDHTRCISYYMDNERMYNAYR